MTSYTSNLLVTQPTPFDPAVKNQWGAILNGDFTLFDSAIAGGLTLSVAGSSDVILTSIQGQPDQARNYSFTFTGALTGDIHVLWPNGVNRNLRVTNSTTGAHSLTVAVNNGSGSPAGAVYAVPQGSTSYLASDGTNISQQITDGSQLTGLNFLPLSGGTLTGNLVILTNASASFVRLASSVPAFRSVEYASTASLRWVHGANGVFETGGNAGSDFIVNRYDDAGTLIDTPMKITRSTGVVSLTATPTFPTATPGDNTTKGATTAFVTNVASGLFPNSGGTLSGGVTISTGTAGATLVLNSNATTLRTVAFQTGGNNRWTVRANNAAESGANAGSDFIISRDNDAGALIDTPMKITRSTGVVSLTQSPTFPTVTEGDNSTNGATTAYVQSQFTSSTSTNGFMSAGFAQPFIQFGKATTNAGGTHTVTFPVPYLGGLLNVQATASTTGLVGPVIQVSSESGGGFTIDTQSPTSGAGVATVFWWTAIGY